MAVSGTCGGVGGCLFQFLRRYPEDALDDVGIADADLNVRLLAKARVRINGSAFDEHAANGIESRLAAAGPDSMEMLENGAVEMAEEQIAATGVGWAWAV